MNRRSILRLGIGAAGLAGFSCARALPGARTTEFDRRRRHVVTAFGRIAYVETGSGPAALFLHGWPLNGYHWRDSMTRLSGIRRCIAPDFMGLGYTEARASADLSPADQCAMIVALLDMLSIHRVDLISNDSGTTVAQLLAARHPERVRTMLLTNGDVHTNSPPELLKPAIAAARAGELIAMFDRHLSEPGFGSTAQGLGGLAYTDPTFFTDELAAAYLRPITATPLRRRQCQEYGVAFEPNPLPAIEPALRVSQIPTRIVWGTGDALFPTIWARWLDAALPFSRGIRLVPKANLFFPEEYPEIIAEEARRLWS